ncbi:MAG: efflux RND transporter periplasmic adaptor subunit [Candidatus Eiseniibacteriota bacterium]
MTVWPRPLPTAARLRAVPLLAVTLLTVTLVAVALVAGCGGGSDDRATTGDGTAVAGEDGTLGKVTNVEVLRLEPRPFASRITITGTVEAMHDAVVSAEEVGAIERFHVKLGAHVEGGQPIAQIDDRLLRAQVKQAEAAAGLARETYRRRERLWTEEHVGSELAFIESKLRSAEADAALEALRARLERTTIRAPFDGVFDAKFLDVGEMASPGVPVVRVIDADRLKVTGGVPERFADDVDEGMQARLTFDVLPGVELESPVDFVGAAIDESNRTFTVEIHIDNPHAAIKPAMIAGIELVRTELENVLIVPQNAVSRTTSGYQVFVVEERDGAELAVARPVRLGPSQSNRVVIEQGLEPGDRVITSGNVDDLDRLHIVGESAGDGDEPVAALEGQS